LTQTSICVEPINSILPSLQLIVVFNGKTSRIIKLLYANTPTETGKRSTLSFDELGISYPNDKYDSTLEQKRCRSHVE